VGTRTWGPAERVDAAPVGAYGPSIAIDTDDNAYIVWSQLAGPPDYFHIGFNRFVPGQGWSGAEILQTGADDPVIAMDPAGNMMMLFRKVGGGNTNIWASEFVAGQGWGGRQLIEDNDAGGAGGYRLGMDADGNAIAVWHQADGPEELNSTRYTVWANRFVAGQGWGNPERIFPGEMNNEAYIKLEVAPSGDAYAVWIEYYVSNPVYMWNRYIPGQGWGTAEIFEAPGFGGGSGFPDIAAGPAGDAMFLWRKNQDPSAELWSNRFVPGQGWGTAELVATLAQGEFQSRQIAVSPAGDAVAVFRIYAGGWPYALANHYIPGQGWGMAGIIETDDMAAADAPTVGIDAAGGAVAVWEMSDGSSTYVRSSRFTPGHGWGAPEVIRSSGPKNVIAARVVVSPSGSAIAAWSETGEEVNEQVWAVVLQ